MANTTIRIKESGVTGNVPASLQAGELAINHADGKLYYGNTTNNALLFDAVTEPSGLDGEVQFNNMGSFGADGDFRFLSSNNTLIISNIKLNGINVYQELTSTISIDDLSDVDITTDPPSNGEILIWDAANTKFVPSVVTAPDGSITPAKLSWSPEDDAVALAIALG